MITLEEAWILGAWSMVRTDWTAYPQNPTLAWARMMFPM